MASLDLAGARRRATNLFSGFTSGQKTVLGLAVAAVLVGGLVFTRWAAKPSYVALYSNLAAADAAAVTEELAATGVSYTLADGGSTVMVPRDSVYQLRLDMSAKNLPTAGSPGYALLDEQGITTSEFKQRVDYQRALEGELAKTIGAIDGMNNATVHLVIPEEDLFAGDETKPTASVLLASRPGQEMSGEQVQSVVHLVSSSVEGLSPQEVTVADASGRMLAAPGQDSATSFEGGQNAAQTIAFEERLATSLEDMLTPVTGAGGAVVRVNATLDHDRRTTTTESFTPGPAPAVNETTTNETYTGTGNNPTGVLGPEQPVAGTAGGDTDYGKESAERNFAVGKVTEEVSAAPGAVERMSVSVLLDGGGDATFDPAEVQDLVVAAAGLDVARGDTIEVSQMAFDTTAADDAEKALASQQSAEQRDQMLALARGGGAVLLLLIVLFLAWRSAKKSSVKRFPLATPIDLALTPAGPTSIDVGAAAAELVATSQEVASLAPAPQDAERLVVENQIGDLIDRQPEEVAQVLRGWLADRRN